MSSSDGELRGGVAIRPWPKAHDPRTAKSTKLLLLPVNRAPNLIFPMARTCGFCVGSAFFYGDLNSLTETCLWLLRDKSQWSEFRVQSPQQRNLNLSWILNRRQHRISLFRIILKKTTTFGASPPSRKTAK